MPNVFYPAGEEAESAACYDALVILQGASGLPEDRFLNTWHFARRGIEDHAAAYSGIQFELGTFYETIKEYLSTVALGAANLQIETRIYHGDDQEPREPHPVMLGVDLTPFANAGIPNELAVCVSFFSERNIPRQRGRVFIGPLANGAMETPVSGEGDRQIATACVNEMVTAATGMLTGTNGVIWCTKSGLAIPDPAGAIPPPIYRQVTDGWVDNAFDVQRRRGSEASSRTTFAA